MSSIKSLRRPSYKCLQHFIIQMSATCHQLNGCSLSSAKGMQHTRTISQLYATCHQLNVCNI